MCVGLRIYVLKNELFIFVNSFVVCIDDWKENIEINKIEKLVNRNKDY